jgi:hypothetical protein
MLGLDHFPAWALLALCLSVRWGLSMLSFLCVLRLPTSSVGLIVMTFKISVQLSTWTVSLSCIVESIAADPMFSQVLG